MTPGIFYNSARSVDRRLRQDADGSANVQPDNESSIPSTDPNNVIVTVRLVSFLSHCSHFNKNKRK